MSEFYELNVAGLTRQLPICKASDTLDIAAFVMFGDVELTIECAKALIEKLPECDVIIAPEAKAIPLLYEMARQLGMNKYIVARKAKKLYMEEPFVVNVRSITTDADQTLILDKKDADYMKGKRVIIVDDVISTGESLLAVEELVNRSGGEIVARAAVLAEGDAARRKDITFLAPLPLFFK